MTVCPVCKGTTVKSTLKEGGTCHNCCGRGIVDGVSGDYVECEFILMPEQRPLPPRAKVVWL